MRRFCTQILSSDNFCPTNAEARTSGYLAKYESSIDRLVLVGLFSYGESVCQFSNRSLEVTVFTKIDQYLEWIVENIQPGKCA